MTMTTIEDLKAILAAYDVGLYTDDEIQWAVMRVLAGSEERAVLWSAVPASIRGEITEYLRTWRPREGWIHFGEGRPGEANEIRAELRAWLEAEGALE